MVRDEREELAHDLATEITNRTDIGYADARRIVHLLIEDAGLAELLFEQLALLRRRA